MGYDAGARMSGPCVRGRQDAGSEGHPEPKVLGRHNVCNKNLRPEGLQGTGHHGPQDNPDLSRGELTMVSVKIQTGTYQCWWQYGVLGDVY
jgi:hypothetical protein